MLFRSDSNERSKRSRVPSGFHSVMFNIKKDQGTVSKPHDTLLASPYSQVLQEVEHPAITDIEYRLLMDRYGNLYWPTSDYPRSHRFFQVTTLSNGKKFYPNQVHMELQSVKDLQEVMNYAAKEGCWKVKKGNYRKANLPGLFGRMQKEDLADYKNIIFDDLSESLEEIANPAGNKNHSVLIVSKEVKKYVVNSISAKWLLEDESSRNWSYKNNQLSLYYLNRDNPLNQEIIAENFHGMEEAAQRQRNVVLYVDLEDIVNFSHPNEGNVDKPYNISVPFESDQDQTSSMTEINGSLSVEEKQEPASLLYILASEGRVIPLKEFMQSGPPEISIMLVGTKQEWDKVKEKTSSFERSYGLLDHFNEISLQTPSITQRRELLLKILDDKANLFNGIEYEGDKIFLKDPSYSTEEIREKVLDYAVSRSQALAQEKGENVFVSFVKLLNQFKLNVKPGSAHEKRGTLHINKAFIESLMCDLYALPLNLRSLPDSDPLRILSHKNSPMKLNEAGYAGNFDIKMRIINGILGQTNSGDQKTIPASFVIFGKRGSGKTFLFSTLVKMLGLKYYEFHADEETNRDAQVFKVNLGNVTSSFSSPGNGETIKVGELITEFDKFLRLPAGKRGFILFDDAHLSSSDVRSQVFSKLRSLFEAKGGHYQGINVRNLSLFMTFNPTFDRDKIRKVAGNETPSPLQLALATFHGEDNKVDESFFNRWGDIINLDFFSTSAKGNELVNKLKSTAKSHFNLENTYFTASTDVVEKIVNKFPKLNARDFLSKTVKSLTGILRQSNLQKPLYLIIPKQKLPYTGTWNEIPYHGSREPSSNDIEDYIRSNFYAISFYEDLRGLTYFVEMITNNFRTNVYRDLITSINTNQQFSGHEILQKHKLTPILHAFKAHLEGHPKIPLSEFPLDRYLINKHLPVSQSNNMEDYIFDMYAHVPSEGFFPEIFSRSYQTVQLADFIVGDSSGVEQQATRLDLLQSYSKKVKRPLEEYLHQMLYIKDKVGLKRLNREYIRNWALALPNQDPSSLTNSMDKICIHLNEFLSDFFLDRNFIENMYSHQFADASHYDATRIFLYVIDKAITMLSWEFTSLYLIHVLDTLSQDMSISTNPGVQNWLFDSGKTLIRPTSKDYIFENIKSLLFGIGEWSKSQEKHHRSEFERKIGELFVSDETTERQ